ncbi:hypothetical protein FALCPG4_008567 [Fusarium falciforme]
MHTIIWRCNNGARNARDSLYFPHTRRNRCNVDFSKDTPYLYSLLPAPPSSQHEIDDGPRDDILNFWLELVGSYSLRTCTVKRDTLNAIANLASLASFRSALETYYAGLWEYNLARQLTWYRSTSNIPSGFDVNHLRYRDGDFGAPSWSWASVDGGWVQFWCEPRDVAPTAVQVHVEVAGYLAAPMSTSNPFGEPRFAQLRLHGVVRMAWFGESDCPCRVFFLPVSASADGKRGG